MSRFPVFHFFLQRSILPQRTMFYVTPGITFQYYTSCQLRYRLLLDKNGVTICKIGKPFYVTTLHGSVIYFVKAVNPETWVNFYIKMIENCENGEIAFLRGIWNAIVSKFDLVVSSHTGQWRKLRGLKLLIPLWVRWVAWNLWLVKCLPPFFSFYQTGAPTNDNQKLSASFSWDVVLKAAQHSGIYTLTITIEKLTHKMDTIYISGKIFNQGSKGHTCKSFNFLMPAMQNWVKAVCFDR